MDIRIKQIIQIIDKILGFSNALRCIGCSEFVTFASVMDFYLQKKMCFLKDSNIR